MCDKCKYKQLVNLHCHSDQSLDGASPPKKIIKRTKELGCEYVSVTEHGNMNSCMDFYTTAKEKGLKPILGIELYLEPFYKDLLHFRYSAEIAAKIPDIDEETLKDKLLKKMKGEYTHLTVHFKDEWAYQYFCSMTPTMEARATVKFGERKPIMLIEELAAAAGHIVIGSGCLVSPVNKWAAPWFDPYKQEFVSRPDLAADVYAQLREIVGPSNFYAEIFPHRVTHNWKYPKREEGKIVEPGCFYRIPANPIIPDGDLQRYANEFVAGLATKHGDRIVISLDSHFAEPAQKVVQDAKLGNGMQSFKFYNSYHMKSTDEAAAELQQMHPEISDADIATFVDNSYDVAKNFDDFKITTAKDRWILQDVGEDWLLDLKRRIDSHHRMDWGNEQMMERLKYEIEVLAYNGTINLTGYFFVVEDIANFCRENEILINVRGSAGGSLLLYVLGVSAFNPLLHDLTFERFLTLGRIKSGSLPDVDVDVNSVERDVVFEYLKKKYGDGFCRLSTDSMLKLKSSIKDAERARYGYVTPETETFVTKLPATPQGINDTDWTFGYVNADGEHIPGLIDISPALLEYSKKHADIWSDVTEMLGVLRQKGGHSCACLVAPVPVQTFSPITIVGGERVTGYAPKSIEAAGGVKFDVLGLNTLSDISGCLKSIEVRTGESLDPWTLPNDEEVWAKFAEGKTETVFQFDTETVRPYLMRIKPSNRDELAAVTALVRPGTLSAPNGDGRTLAEAFVARRAGESVQYIHPDLEPILGGTYGIQLYQESTMRIFRDIGGFTYEEAEEVRRGIGKKIESVLRTATEKLGTACLGRGWTEEQVNLLMQQIMASSKYSFNCIDADQKILTRDGPVRFQEICESPQEYEVAYSVDGRIEFEHPTTAINTGEKEVFEITLEDGSTIMCTKDHRFLTDTGWVTAEDLMTEGVWPVTENLLAKKRILCKCGQNVSRNTLVNHMRSEKCNLDPIIKAPWIKLLETKKNNQWAWRKSEGTETVATTD